MAKERRTFGVIVRDLLLEKGYATGIGNPNWSGFAIEAGIGYETLRKAATGERAPGEALMEQVAEALDVEPETFFEYELFQAQRAFDPREVGAEEALANLEAWNKSQKR